MATWPSPGAPATASAGTGGVSSLVLNEAMASATSVAASSAEACQT